MTFDWTSGGRIESDRIWTRAAPSLEWAESIAIEVLTLIVLLLFPSSFVLVV